MVDLLRTLRNDIEGNYSQLYVRLLQGPKATWRFMGSSK